MLGSIAQLVQSVCLTSRGSGVRLPLLPLQEKHFGYPRCFFQFVRHGLHPFPRHVRTKTFSAHITFKIHHVVRKSCVFAHERILPGSRIKTSPLPHGLSTFYGYLVPNKRFKRYQVHFQSHLVPFKTFSRNGTANSNFRCYLTLT